MRRFKAYGKTWRDTQRRDMKAIVDGLVLNGSIADRKKQLSEALKALSKIRKENPLDPENSDLIDAYKQIRGFILETIGIPTGFNEMIGDIMRVISDQDSANHWLQFTVKEAQITNFQKVLKPATF
jgi:hypothetical protein